MIDFKKLVRSFRFAWSGIWFAFVHNQNLQIHFVFAIAVILLSIYFRITGFEMGILGVMILLVMSTEMINTAIEQMVDFVTREHREEARIAKDVSAGMVLLTVIGSVIVGILIFVPHVYRSLSN